MAAGNTRRRKRGKSVLLAPLAFLAVCAVLVFSLSVFFHVSEIEVVGNAVYSAEEVISASEVEEGDNLVFLNRFAAVSRIYSKLSYIEEVNIRRELPSKVVIEVTESTSVAYITLDGQHWVVDKNGKLLGTATESETLGLIKVTGITLVEPITGLEATAGEGDEGKMDYLCEILSEILSRGLQGHILSIDLTDVMDAELSYLGRFEVHLGPSENTSHKFGMLLSAVSQMADGDSGKLDLSVDDRAYYTPD